MIPSPQPGFARVQRRGLKIPNSHATIDLLLSDTGSPGAPGVTFPRVISIHPSTRHNTRKTSIIAADEICSRW